MEGILLPLVIGLIGATIGALASIITVIVQGHYQNKREERRVSVQIAVEEFKVHKDLVKPGESFPPLSAYIYFYTNLMKLAEKGDLSPDNVPQLMEASKRFIEAVDEYQKNVSELNNQQAQKSEKSRRG